MAPLTTSLFVILLTNVALGAPVPQSWRDIIDSSAPLTNPDGSPAGFTGLGNGESSFTSWGPKPERGHRPWQYDGSGWGQDEPSDNGAPTVSTSGQGISSSINSWKRAAHDRGDDYDEKRKHNHKGSITVTVSEDSITAPTSGGTGTQSLSALDSAVSTWRKRSINTILDLVRRHGPDGDDEPAAPPPPATPPPSTIGGDTISLGPISTSGGPVTSPNTVPNSGVSTSGGVSSGVTSW